MNPLKNINETLAATVVLAVVCIVVVVWTKSVQKTETPNEKTKNTATETENPVAKTELPLGEVRYPSKEDCLDLESSFYNLSQHLTENGPAYNRILDLWLEADMECELERAVGEGFLSEEDRWEIRDVKMRAD